MWLLRILGIARLPVEADALIGPTDRIIVCENLSCTITYRNFRAPGRACNWKRQWFPGSIALSRSHVVAFRWGKRLINTSFDDPRFSGLSVTTQDDLLVVSHDAALYRENWTGTIEYRFQTPEADRIATVLQNRKS